MGRMTRALIALAIIAAACGQTDQSSGRDPSLGVPAATALPEAMAPIDPENELVAGNAHFAVDLFRQLAGDEDNVLISPASISEGLALPYLGARGVTATEMAFVMNYTLEGDALFQAMASLRADLTSRQNDQLELAIANRAFGQDGFPFRDAFLADLSRWYEAGLGTVDFSDVEAARTEINDWTAAQTNDRIPELFPSGVIKPNTRLVLVNAVYLKADWHFPFNPELTTPQPFTLLDGTEVNVDMMNFNEFLPNGSTVAWSAVQMPYAGEEMSMFVVLPDNFERFKRNFNTARIEKIRETIDAEAGIHLHLPKFELSYSADLAPALRDMGMVSAFGPADFSGINEGGGLFITAVIHETFVEVDEAGTEAAGATGTPIAVSHGPTIIFDKPFVFWVQDDATGAILLLGQVTDPRGNG